MRRVPSLVAVALSMVSAATAAELGDPTRPAVAPPAAEGANPDVGLRLRALIVSGARREARIGEQRVGVGDEIDGARVVAIGLDGVRLSRGGDEILLTLTGAGLKRPAAARRNTR